MYLAWLLSLYLNESEGEIIQCQSRANKGHIVQCPQRRQGQGKPMNRPGFRGRGTGRPGGSSKESPQGRRSAPTWQRGTFRGRGKPFNGRTPNTRAGVAQITEVSDNDEREREEPSQNPEQDF